MTKRSGKPRRSRPGAKRLDNKRLRLIERDGNICCWCETPFDEDDKPTFEHLHSSSWVDSNLALAHSDCNNYRSNKPDYEFYQLVNFRRAEYGLDDLEPFPF